MPLAAAHAKPALGITREDTRSQAHPLLLSQAVWLVPLRLLLPLRLLHLLLQRRLEQVELLPLHPQHARHLRGAASAV